MRRQICPVLLLVALALGPARSHAMTPQVSATRSEIDESVLRGKRGTVTIDLGMILRNLLLKSAQFSSAKAIKATTKRPPTTTTTTTTTTTAAPPPPPLRQRPIWHPPGYYSFGYLPFDYDTDYEDPLGKAPVPTRRPQRPQSTQRLQRPLYLQRQSPGPALAARYEADYDYDAPPPPKQTPPAPSLPKRPRPRLQPRQPLPQPQTQTQPQARRPAAELGDRLVYQYAQSTDTYYRPRVVGGGAAAQGGTVEADPEDAPAPDGNGDDEDDDGDDGTDAADPNDNYNGADVERNSGADLPWFVVNYANENENDSADFSRESSDSSGQQELRQPPRNGIPVHSSGYVYRDPIS